MPVTVDWPNKIVSITKSYMVLVQPSPPIYQLDMDVLRKDLKALEASEQGMSWPDIHSHNPTVTVSGAILARVVQFINGYTVTFEDGQYRVNVVGANTNIGDVTNVNQVSVSTSNSAGLQDLNSLQAASFNGVVAVKVSSSFVGTTFPIGTRAAPVNNLADAHAIAEARGLNRFAIMESMTIAGVAMSDGYVFEGDSPVTVSLTIDPSADITNAEFQNLNVSGTLDGNNVFRQCVIGNVSYVNGFLFQSSLTGTVTLGGSAQANIFDCYSGIAGGGPGAYPIIDFGGDQPNDLALRGYDGGLLLRNMNHVNADASLDFDSGRLVVENTNLLGELYVRGVCDVTDNGGGVNLYDLTVSREVRRTRRILANRQETVNEAGTIKLKTYEDDGVTVAEESVITKSDDSAPDITQGVAKRGAPVESP